MNFPLPNFGYNSVYKTFNGIDLRQTSLCPNKCVMCAKAQKGHRHRTMSMEDLRFVLDVFPDYERGVWLLGTGEVFMLENLPERIALIKSLWPKCTVNTLTTFNIFRGKSWLAELFSAGLDNVYVSCYGYTEDDYHKLHGSPSFSGLMQNIEAIGKLQHEIGDKIHFKYFHDMERLFGVRDAEQKRKNFMEIAARNHINCFEARNVFPWSQTIPANGKSLWELPSPCSVVWGGTKPSWIYILENLDVVPCCLFLENDFIFGNLRENTLEEIFTGEKFRFFYESWWAMRPDKIPVCNTCQCYDAFPSSDELSRFAAWQAGELRGQKVVFWGAGEAYRAYKSFFADCEPVAVLVDSYTNQKQKEIDGIPLRHPDEFLPTLTEPLPLVIFAMQKASPRILRTLKEKYAFYKPSKLVICPANAQITAPVEPFFQD